MMSREDETNLVLGIVVRGVKRRLLLREGARRIK